MRYDELLRGDYFDTTTSYTSSCMKTKNAKASRSLFRPLLEGYLRVQAAKEFKADEWLGDMIQKLGKHQAGALFTTPAANGGLGTNSMSIQGLSPR